ncbi:MAG: putative polyketide biosynthesis zinc-dependent hydrolase PksB [Planctomycetota bacterium]|jgi:glyoxylase-like metal-dependent hydrolase (beta-lactamase superfamily II)/rhodanese-related sulfurtransferase
MIIKQYYLSCLAHASYLIADERSKIAAVVDPQRDIQQYLDDAAAAGYTIRYVFLTHFHADFLAGHIELRNQAGAQICLGNRAGAEFEHLALKDGDNIMLGDVRIQIMETPGHTPEGISLLVFDQTRSTTEPHAVLTGDTLFIGDVGRPDLLASIGVTADELAAMLYNSVNRLRQLPDATLVYPAHGAGSLCGKALSKDTVSTIGEQKKFNYALQPMPFEQFRTLVTAEQPEAPGYFVYDAIRNRQERPDLDQTMHKSLQALPLQQVLRLQQAKAQLLDVRDAIDFAGASLKGTLQIGLQGKYATWCGSLLNHDDPIVVIGDDNEQEAVVRLGRIGFDNVVGYLQDGMQSLQQHPELIQTVPRITAAALAELLQQEPPFVLDVRSEKEYAIVHLQGSSNVPLTHLRERLQEIPADRPVVVHCEGGYRSAIACSILLQAGRTNVSDLVGGIKAWIATKLPTIPENTLTCGTKVCEIAG